MAIKELRGTRYLTAANNALARFIVDDLPYLDFPQTLAFYGEVVPRLDLRGRALLGVNDRYFLLTGLCRRSDALHPWLFARCREVEADPDGYIDLWARFHYKAVDVKEPVPTPDGWRLHGDLRPGDRVFGRDGRPRTVIAKTPVFKDADCWRVTTDKGYSVVVSGDHLWTVDLHSRARIGRAREKRRTATIDTRALAAEVARSKVYKSRVLPSLPVTDPVQYAAMDGDLSIAPYLLGLWLGDGSSACGRITGHPNDDEVFKRVTDLGYKVGERKGFSRQIYGIRPILRSIGVLQNKHVPLQYLYGSVEDRWELLRGLMDSDGHCDTRGTATFTTTLEILAANVFELAASLGLKPSHRPLPTGAYQVSFQSGADRPPAFSLTRKAARASSSVPGRSRRHAIVSVEAVESRHVSCIQIDDPDGVYLIGTHFVPTHNSTIITFAGAIQEILINPEITIAIFSCTKPIARGFLQQIMREFENNDYLKQVYPDVLWDDPRREAPVWGMERGLVVRRRSNPKESTIEAHGLIDGQPTSRHYDLHIYDDMVTRENVTTPEMIKKTTEAWELADNLGKHHGVRKWMPGTRYSFGDTYGVVLERRILKPRKYPATIDGTLKGEPVFLSREHWEKIKNTQRSTVSAQMLQNPVAGNEAVFKSEWFRPYLIRPTILNVYIMVDPSKGRSATSDRTAMAVIGVDGHGNKYLLDGVRHRMSLSERWGFLKRLYLKWRDAPGVQSIAVGYERYGAQTEDEMIKEWQERDGVAFELIELNWPREGGHSKRDRVERLEPDMRIGKFFLPGLVHQPEFGGRDGVALWSVWTEEDAKRAEGTPYNVGQIIYRPLNGDPKEHRAMDATMQGYRKVKPIKHLDEDRTVYDLTRALMEECMFFPFAPHDDLIDAVSRIYDMSPRPAVQYETASLEPAVYADS